jgi:O-antigen/teichoic acid export membrane protein
MSLGMNQLFISFKSRVKTTVENSHTFLKNSIIVSAATLLSFLTQVYVARNTNLGDFAILTTFNVFLNVIGVFYAGIQYETSRLSHQVKGYSTEENTTKISTFITSIVCTSIALGTFLKLTFLKDSQILSWKLFGVGIAYLIISPLLVYVSGILQSRGELVEISILSLALIGGNLSVQILFSKMITFSPMSYLTIQAIILVLLLSYIIPKRKIPFQTESRTSWNKALLTILTIFIFNVFINIDIIVSPFIWPSDDAGNFSLLAVLSRYYIVFVPFLTARLFNFSLNSNLKITYQELLRNLRLIFAIWLLFTLLFAISGISLLNRIYGNQYSIDTRLFLTYSAVSLIGAFSTQFVILLIRFHSFGALVFSGLVVMMYLLVLTNIEWRIETLWVLNLVFGSIMLVGFIVILSIRKSTFREPLVQHE